MARSAGAHTINTQGRDNVAYLRRLSRFLAAAGFLAMALVGCGKETPEVLVDSAKTFSAKGDYKAAAIQLRNVLQKQPENGEARFLLGQALNEEMDYVTAEKELRKALEYGYAADRPVPGARASRCSVRASQGGCRRVQRQDPSRSRGPGQPQDRSRTCPHWLGPDATRRAPAFDAALKAKPGYDRARVGQAMLVASEKDVAGAMKIVDEVLAVAPTLTRGLESQS